MVNVPVNDFVNLETQLLCNLGLLWPVDLAHKREEVVTTLWPSVSNIQIMQSNILHNLLLLMDVSLGNGHVLLSF